MESDGDGKQQFLIFRQRQAGVDESSNRANKNKNVRQRLAGEEKETR
jgi:hypothetical protein